jgi:hypothetical protein
VTDERQLNEPVPSPSRAHSIPLLLGDEWDVQSPSRARVLVIAAFSSVALIVTCIVLLRSRERMTERHDEGSWVSFDSGGPFARVAGTLSHVDQSEPTEVLEAPPPPARPPSPMGRGGQGVRTKGRGGQGVRTTPAGYLSINSSPWAELSVDGRVVGTTPQVKIRLTPGRHHLLLARAGFQTHSAWVDVVAGSTVRLTGITLMGIAR